MTEIKEPSPTMWVVYTNTKDHPGYCVARCFEGTRPTEHCIMSMNYESIRKIMEGTGRHKLSPCPGDDPCIKEIWV